MSFSEYARMTRELFAKDDEGEEAEKLRDAMDGVWYSLTSQECQQAGLLAQDYYELHETADGNLPKVDPAVLESLWSAFRTSDGVEDLRTLHAYVQDRDHGSKARSLQLRRQMWELHGLPEIAKEFTL